MGASDKFKARLLKKFSRTSREDRRISLPIHSPAEPIPIFRVALSHAVIASRIEAVAPLAYTPSPINPQLPDQQFVHLYKYWCPAIVIRTLDYLNKQGLDEEGLYRVPGSTETIKLLKHEFDCYGDVLIETMNAPDREIQVADVASLFKLFLRELPSPIITNETVKELERDIGDLSHVRTTLSTRMPPYEFYLLSLLCDHLCRVNAKAEQNKMDINNLAIVFCSSSNLGFGSNMLSALVKYEVWADLRCETERQALQDEAAVHQRESSDEILEVSVPPTPTSAQIAAAVFK